MHLICVDSTDKYTRMKDAYNIRKIHLIKGYISLHSCQIMSPSETGFIVSAHRLPNITLLTLLATL